MKAKDMYIGQRVIYKGSVRGRIARIAPIPVTNIVRAYVLTDSGSMETWNPSSMEPEETEDRDRAQQREQENRLAMELDERREP